MAGGLLTAAIAGDRWAAGSAADRLADRLRCAGGLAQRPEVTVGGMPFLTQLARGRFDDVRVEAAAVEVGRFHAGVAARARQVRTAAGSVRAASLTVEATFRYAELTAPDDVPGRAPGEFGYDGAGRLRLATTAPVLGREVPVVVHAAPELTGPDLVVRPVEVEVPAIGIRIPADRLGDRARPRVIGLPALPAGLAYQGVTATPDGLRITAGGADIGVPGGRGGEGGRGCGRDAT
ncbi:hypothetical protein Aoc01nite_51420 [Actinoplanes octamycinicus]|nr:hypothetical protein Aoc01nite_51420 [Actinoplanes octamycinicus]